MMVGKVWNITNYAKDAMTEHKTWQFSFNVQLLRARPKPG